MNRIELPRAFGEARVQYLDGDYKILSQGSYVRCAVTALQIPIDELKYWSVERQEAYVDAAAALKRYQQFAR